MKHFFDFLGRAKSSFATLVALSFLCVFFSSCSSEDQTKEYVKAVQFSAEEREGGTRMTVSMTTETEGAVIFYTTDGSSPPMQSAKYTGAITFMENKTIKAFAVKEGLENSPISVATVSIAEKTIIIETDSGNSYNHKLDISSILVRKSAEKNYIWENGVKTERYNRYFCPIDLTESFTRLPKAGETVKITWKGTSDKAISKMQLKLVDNNTKTANWGAALSETIEFSDIFADKDFSVDHTFTFSNNPIEKVILQFIYMPDILDTEATFKVSGLLFPIKKDFSMAPSDAPVINPHKGFVQYAWSNGFINNQYWDAALASGKNEAWDYCTVVYTGCGWSKIQKGEHEYDWTFIDNLLKLCAENGRTLGWRIYPTDTGAKKADEPGSGEYVPQYIYDKGCGFVDATIKGTETKIRVPDWSDPIYIQACKDFAAEMARRYDGDSRVEFIDIRSFGNWGEWHCSQLDGSEMPSEEIQKDMIAYYKSVFKTTQLVIPSDCRGDVYQYALSLGIAKRDDGLIQIADRENDLAKCYEAGLPTVGENCDIYEKLLNLDNSDRWHQQWTLERWKSVINVAHLTYYELDRQSCAMTFFKDNAEHVKEMTNKLGYNFEVTAAHLDTDENLKTQLSVTIKNTGLAPAFFDVHLIAEVIDQSGKRKAQIGSIKKIKKGSFADGDEKTYVFYSDFTSICSGDRICIGLYEDPSAASPNVKFDNKNTLKNNKLVLGEL